MHNLKGNFHSKNVTIELNMFCIITKKDVPMNIVTHVPKKKRDIIHVLRHTCICLEVH